jgi:hypothetical protein
LVGDDVEGLGMGVRCFGRHGLQGYGLYGQPFFDRLFRDGFIHEVNLFAHVHIVEIAELF